MNQCLLHVGLHKTGTTTLQRDLKAAGFAFNHVKPWAWEGQGIKVVNTTHEITPHKEFDFFSWEQLSFMDQAEASKLIERLRLSYSKIIVVLVLRDPATLYASHKNQSVKHSSTSHPPAGVFERELYGISPTIKDVPADCWYLDEQHHRQKWKGCDELRVLRFEEIAGTNYTRNFIEQSQSGDFFADLDGQGLAGNTRQSNPSIDHARFIVASHIYKQNLNGSLSEKKLRSYMLLLLKEGLQVSTPLAPKDVDEDFIANDSGISVLNFTLDLLEEIHKLRQQIKNNAIKQEIKRATKAARNARTDALPSNEPQAEIEESLQKFPNQIDLLTIATDIYRAAGACEKSLEYSERLIKYHPGNWVGYARAAQDKLSLSRFDSKEDIRAFDLASPPPPKTRWHAFWNSIRACTNTPTSMAKKDQWIASFSLINQRHAISSLEGIEQWQPFQYWSQGEPPHDVRKVTNAWNRVFDSIGIPCVQTFNRASALDYIEKYCPELSTPFLTAFHYAVEADVFRVAFAQRNNCIWLDSDLYPTIHAKDLIVNLLATPRTTLFFRWHKPWVTNAFFLTPSSSEFFKLIMNESKDCDFRLLPRNKNTIFSTFGPDRYNKVLESMLDCTANQSINGIAQTPNCDPLGFNFVNEHNFASMRPPFKLAYQATSDSWQKSIPKSS